MQGNAGTVRTNKWLIQERDRTCTHAPNGTTQQALISYGIAFLRKRQYSVLQPPYFMNRDVMAGVAQLEQFDEELYKVRPGDDCDLLAAADWMESND